MTLKNLIIATVAASVALTAVHADALKGRGASFQGPVYKAWTSEYFKATGYKATSDLGYVPLPKEIKEAIRSYLIVKGIK